MGKRGPIGRAEFADDEAISVRDRMHSLAISAAKYERAAKKMRELYTKLAERNFYETLGIAIGEEYEFKNMGRLYRGKVLGVSIDKREHCLLIEVPLRNRTPVWRILPQQMLGFETLPQDEVKEAIKALNLFNNK